VSRLLLQRRRCRSRAHVVTKIFWTSLSALVSAWTIPGFLAHLQEHGYVVVKEVASAVERTVAEDLFWQFLVENAGFVRDDPSTWTDEQFERVGCVATGIISRAGIGQSDFMWYLRVLPAVRKAFASIWGTPDLLTSFDAANIFRPWRQEELGLSKT